MLCHKLQVTFYVNTNTVRYNLCKMCTVTTFVNMDEDDVRLNNFNHCDPDYSFISVSVWVTNFRLFLSNM